MKLAVERLAMRRMLRTTDITRLAIAEYLEREERARRREPGGLGPELPLEGRTA